MFASEESELCDPDSFDWGWFEGEDGECACKEFFELNKDIGGRRGMVL
jgi:hypothetical protein